MKFSPQQLEEFQRDRGLEYELVEHYLGDFYALKSGLINWNDGTEVAMHHELLWAFNSGEKGCV
jgi:hypothetical protein